MAEIVLATLNARYHHSSFGLRYLRANLGPLRERSEILEFTINESTLEIVDRIVQAAPRIVGFGVYIWNVTETTRVVRILKTIRPELVIVIGGPEVSYESEGQTIVQLADFTIRGEADFEFRNLCTRLLATDQTDTAVAEIQLERGRLIDADLPSMEQITLPYDEYSEQDLATRVLYVEASRGCPFTCEFCLSALDIPVRQVPVDRFLDQMQRLLDRGARQFKFVDRTFNLNLRVSRAILEFFLARLDPDLFLHFEMIPDRLPEDLRAIISEFPAGVLQFEVGIQTFDEDVSERISRRQNVKQLEDNLRFLRTRTGVHLHTDLIVGLPGEDLATFGQGFDRLVALNPQEIQVGILKRLRGTPIIRHDTLFRMTYSPDPPYELLCNDCLAYEDMSRMRRFARFWDLIANSGRFTATLPRVLSGGSAFQSFLLLSDWLFERTGRAWGISTVALAELLFEFLITERGEDHQQVAEVVWIDYTRAGRSDRPKFLRDFELPAAQKRPSSAGGGRRQQLHVSAETS